MQKKMNNSVFVYPMPLVLVGSGNSEKNNFMAVGWVTRVNNQPSMFAVAINKGHLTNENIRKTGEFSIIGVECAQKEIADYCGMNSGRKIDKSGLFETFNGELANAPLIVNAPYNIACRVAQTIELPTNTLFIGEVVEAYCREDVIVDNKPDLAKIDPLIFTMPDLRYWNCAGSIGKAWGDGANFKK